MANLSNSQRRHREKNRHRQCAVSSCFKQCFNSSQYCANHARRKQQYGHPEGVPITRQDLKPYVKAAKQFLKKHKDHKAVTTAILILDEFLSQGALLAEEYPENKSFFELRRLHDNGLKGKEALAVLCAVWLYAHSNARRLPDDIRLTYALSRALLGSRPQVVRNVTYCLGKERRHYGKPGASVHSEIGKALRDKLGIFFVNMIKALEKEEDRAQELKRNLAEPFDNSLQGWGGDA